MKQHKGYSVDGSNITCPLEDNGNGVNRSRVRANRKDHKRRYFTHKPEPEVQLSMDVTNFIVSQREKALLVGDYATYRKQLSRRLHVVRKKLHYTSAKGKKYAARPALTAEDIAANHEYVKPSALIYQYSCYYIDLSTYSCLLRSEHGPWRCT